MDLVLGKSGRSYGDRKRLYMFIVDEEYKNGKRVVKEKEQLLLKLKPDFKASGQIKTCAKENVLFWLKNHTFHIGHILAIGFYFDPSKANEVRESLNDVNSFVELHPLKHPQKIG